MAATGRKTVAPGQTIASQWGNLVWDQSIQDFASGPDRTTQFPTPKPGNATWLEDIKALHVWDGTRWLAVMAALPPLQAPLVQRASTTVTTTGAGGFGITFPAAFTNTPTVVATDGNSTASFLNVYGTIPGNTSPTAWGGVVRAAQNGSVVASTSVIIHWIAIGS